MNVWDLIRFNYQTSDPREVNWYLHHRTGCKTADWDGKNFKFDDSDDPGIIHIPPYAYDRMLETGLKPKKFYSEEEVFRVPGYMRTFSQNFKNVTCWAIAGSMMISWKNPYLVSVAEALDSLGGPWRSKFDDKSALDDDEMRRFTSAARLSRGGLLDTPEMRVWALDTLGPLMVVQSSMPGYVHWIVVNGYHIEPPSSFRLSYIEPSNGTSRKQYWETITSACKSAQGSLPAMYYWK
jgi:hypothetical protein